MMEDLTATNKLFYADDKFYPVIQYLEDQGWQRTEVLEDSVLIYTNLKRVDFTSIGIRFVNHFKGSQHLSNKSYLAYHLRAAGFANIMPEQWSSSFQCIPELICLLTSSIISEETNSGGARTEPQSGTSCSELLISFLLDVWAAGCQNSSADVDRCLPVLQAIRDNIKSGATLNDSKNVWIVKPVGLSCGENIVVVRSIRQVLLAVASLEYKCVVQKYIERPILVRNGRKFDIRQWILVNSINPLRIYGFSECYARLSARTYDISSDEALRDEAIHLCNHAIQKKGTDPLQADQTTGQVLEDVWCDTMMTQSQLDCALTEQFNSGASRIGSGVEGAEVQSVFNEIILPQIKSIALSIMKATRDKITMHGRGFEWLGLDLMICEGSWQVLLLEVNVSPDISFSTPVTGRLVPTAVRTMFDILEITASTIGEFHTNSSPPSESHSTGLAWQLWHEGNGESLMENRSFAKEKRLVRECCSPLNSTPLSTLQLKQIEVVYRKYFSSATGFTSKSCHDLNSLTMDAYFQQQVLSRLLEPGQICVDSARNLIEESQSSSNSIAPASATEDIDEDEI